MKDFDSTHIETADDGNQTTVESIWDEAWEDLKAAEQSAADEALTYVLCNRVTGSTGMKLNHIEENSDETDCKALFMHLRKTHGNPKDGERHSDNHTPNHTGRVILTLIITLPTTPGVSRERIPQTKITSYTKIILGEGAVASP